jgi:hypothetical protein
VLVTGANATLASLPSFTLFAPNDRAFEVLANKVGVLGPDHRYGATVDEKAVTLALVNALGADKIRPVLLYHVLVGAKVTGKQVLSGPFYQRLTMANGQKLSVTVLSRSAVFPIIILGDIPHAWVPERPGQHQVLEAAQVDLLVGQRQPVAAACGLHRLR